MGIYSWLEKRWYDFLDVVNKAIPIYGLTDKIDSVIPSFLLFLLLVLLLVVVGGYYFLGNGFPQIPWTGGGGGIVEQTVTITVLSNTGGALSEALVEYDQNCNGEIKSNSLITNASGKGSFKACASSVNISVSKSGYDSKSALLILPTDKEKTINLSITEPVPSKRTVSVRIIDAEGTEITQAKLEFVCVKNASSTTRQINSASGSEYQPSGGFEFEINENCDSANLNATAQGYTDKTRVLGNDDVEKTIQLEVAVIKGTVIFTADSPLGPQGGAIITITDHLGRVQTITTTSSGNVERELDEGNYTYSAFLKGYTKTGSFSIEANSTIEKTIYFTELTPANPERFIKLRLKGRDANILVGEARIFYRKSGDVNLFVTATTDSNGLIGPVPIQDTNGRTYFAVIKSTGYKTQIYSSIVLLKEEEQPQIVQLYLGSPVLTVHVIDDVGSGVASTTSLPCVTRVILSGYPEDFFDTVTTDSNGNAIYRGLPDGNYLVTAINDLDDGSNWAYVGASDTEIQITLVTGTGTVRFRFYLGNDVVSSSYKILQKVGDDFNVIKVSTTPSTYADTVQLRSGSQVKIETIGADYFPSESFVYTIKRGAQEKRVILRNSDTIPNANPVQLILRKILTTNPINSVETVSPTQALEAGHTYYFLYDLVLNSIGDGNIIVNAYVSGQTLIGSKGMLLEGAKSIFGTATILTNTKQQFVIDKNVVDHDAIQLNILAQTQTSPKTIPLFFIISIDNNSEQSQQSLYWQARFADKESAAYKKDFNINNVYCFEDCPAILFSPQLKIGTQAWGAITSSINKLIVGDNYRIKLGAENISDNNYGDVNLELKTSSLLINRQALAFKDNLAHEVYSVSKITALSPFSKVTSDLEAVLYPKKASSSAEIPVYRTISQNGANPNPFASLNGGDAAKLRFSVKNRGEVGIEINLAGKINTINEKVNYPFMTVKTFLQPTILGGLITPISAYWEVSDKTGIILSGHKTDSNGIELWTFDASAYKVGDKITFKAWDEESSTPAVLVIEVTNPFDPEPDSPSCLKIQLPDGTDIKSLTNPILNIDYSETGEIDINSTCNTQRTIKVNSDFTPPENSVDVKKGETAHISFDVKEVIDERNGTLGAYPLQVLEKTGSTTWDQIGFLDIVVTDSNVNAAPFELSNAVFDFSNAENVPAYVTNKTLAGRLDVYYPQMEIDKSGLGIVYSKGGVPQLLDLDFNIDTNALEGITYGYLVSQSFGVAVKDFGGTANCKNQLVMAYLATPNTTGQSLQGYLNGTSGLKFNPYYGCSALAGAVDYNFLFDTIGAQIDGNIANRYLNYPSQNRVRTCGDLCDPTKPFYSLPIESQDTILSQIPNARITAAPIGTEETNLDTLHFSIANPTPKPVPLKQVKGDIYETYPQAVNIPLTAVQVGCGDVNTWKLADVDILSIAPLGFSSSKWNVAYRDTNGRLFVCNKYASTDINFVNFTNSSLNEYLDLKRYFGWGGMLLHNSVPSFRMVGGTATTVVGATIPANINQYQSEIMSAVTLVNERSKSVRKTVSGIDPVEGTVINLGTYDYQLDPVWTDVNSRKLFGKYSVNDTWGINGYFSGGANWPQITCTNTKLNVKNADSNYFNMWYAMQSAAGCYLSPALNPTSVVCPLWGGTCTLSQGTYDYGADNIDGLAKAKALYSNQLGFISFDSVKGSNGKYYPVPDNNDPLAEFHADGKIFSRINPKTVPAGYRVFLKDGNVYAEYIGLKTAVSSPSSKIIDFNLLKKGQLTSGYAILTVRDWAVVNDKNVKVSKKFQIKIVGGEAPCESVEGDKGVSGSKYNPRLYYNWGWQTIQENQCDSINPNYKYCDATQFLISLFKKFNLIQDAYYSGPNYPRIAQLSSGFVYLIKDNYSPIFLQDFKDYYSNQGVLDVSDWFRSTSLGNGLDTLISENKVLFKVRDEMGAEIIGVNNPNALPYGGIYAMDINIQFDNLYDPVLLDGLGNPKATIIVTLTAYKKTSEMNPFYEIPFDGEVGKTLANTYGYVRGTSDGQGNYGTSVIPADLASGTEERKLLFNTNSCDDDSCKAHQTVYAMKDINYAFLSNTDFLNKGIVLNYSSASGSNNLLFAPSQPNPIMMTIIGNSATINAAYSLQGFGPKPAITKIWTKRASSISGGCRDFKGEIKTQYADKILASDVNRVINWTSSVRTGTMLLSTTFFTPLSTLVSGISLKQTPNSAIASLDGYKDIAALKGSGKVNLNYYDTIHVIDYKTLQGMFDRVANGDMCMLKTDGTTGERMKIWWNPEKINFLEEQGLSGYVENTVDVATCGESWVR